MQKWKLSLFILLFPGLAAAIDGHELYDICGVALDSPDYENAYGTGYCYGYLVGVINQSDHSFCPPDEVTNKQTLQIVHSFLKDHLEQLNEPANTLVLKALHKLWPCENE